MCKKMFTALLIVLLACLLLPAAGRAGAGPDGAGGAWPQFQNDLYNDGVTGAAAPLSAPATAWKQASGEKTPGRLDLAPLVAGGSVFVLDDSGKLWAFDAGTGALNWATQLSAAGQQPQLATPAYDGGVLYAATNDGHVDALDAATGAVEWEQALPLASASSQLNTPVKMAGGKLYVAAWNPDATSDEYYYCLDAASGQPGIGSSYQVPNSASPGGYYGAGAGIVGRCLIFGSDHSTLTCLDKDSGALLDAVNLKKIVPGAQQVRSSVSYDPASGLVFLTDQATTAGSCWAFGLDADSGKLTPRWHTQLGFSASTPAVYNGRVYVGTGLYSIAGGIYCLDEATGSVVWKFLPASGGGAVSVPGVQASPVVAVQGGTPYIYFPTICEHSTVYCLDQDGRQVWQFSDQDLSYIHQGLAAAGGWLYFAGDSGLYALAPATAPVTGVTLSKTSDTIAVGASDTLVATVIPGNAADQGVTWTSDNPGVASVTDGTVTGHVYGAAGITVTTADGGFTATCLVTVPNSATAIPVTGVTLSKTSDTIDAGASDTLTATVTPSGAGNRSVAWTSGNTTVATVDQTGKVTAAAAGTAKITVTTKNGGFTATCLVTVNSGGPGLITVHLTINDQSHRDRFQHDVSLQQGQTVLDALLAAARIDPALDPQVDYNCIYITGGYVESLYGEDSPFGAQADGWVYFVNGVEPDVGAGIYGKADYQLLNNGDSILWRWSWMQPVSAISLNQGSASIPIGQSRSLSAVVSPADSTNQAVTWSSSNPAAATVDRNGTVTVVGPGTAVITATSEDGGFTATSVINGPAAAPASPATVPTAGAPKAAPRAVAAATPPSGAAAHLSRTPAGSAAPQGGAQSWRVYALSAVRTPAPVTEPHSGLPAGTAAILAAVVFLLGAGGKYAEHVRDTGRGRPERTGGK